MIITIIIACIFAKIKHYKLRYLFSSRTFYPILVTQCILFLFQISIFCGTYYFVRYAAMIQKAIILSFLFPILAFRLYRPAAVGLLSVAAGTGLNRFVIAQNGGKMPVFPSLSYLTGYCSPGSFGAADSVHVLGGEATKYWFLADYIDVGYSVLSPGDLLVHLFVLILLYYTIKAINLQRQSDEKISDAR